MRVRVRGPQGAPLSFGRSVVRVVGLALAIIPCFAGFVPALFDGTPPGLARPDRRNDGRGGRLRGVDDDQRHRDVVALPRRVDGVLLEPFLVGGRPNGHDELVGRELPQAVVGGLDGVLRADPARGLDADLLQRTERSVQVARSRRRSPPDRRSSGRAGNRAPARRRTPRPCCPSASSSIAVRRASAVQAPSAITSTRWTEPSSGGGDRRGRVAVDRVAVAPREPHDEQGTDDEADRSDQEPGPEPRRWPPRRG